MLNTVLTVRAHQANSHRGIGWEEFTDAAIMALNGQDRPDRIYFMGRSGAEKKGDAESTEASDIDSAAPESADRHIVDFSGADRLVKRMSF